MSKHEKDDIVAQGIRISQRYHYIRSLGLKPHVSKEELDIVKTAQAILHGVANKTLDNWVLKHY